MRHPICVLTLLLALLTSSYSIGAAQTPTTTPVKPVKSLKPAASNPTTTDAKVDVATLYTQAMADQANLDTSNPQLSSNGFLSQIPQTATTTTQAVPALASSECLIAQTLLAGYANYDPDNIRALCTDLSKKQHTYEEYSTKPPDAPDSPSGTPPTDKASKPSAAEPQDTKIDYALIHIVRWSTPAATAGSAAVPAPTATWYLFDRGHYQKSGSLIPWSNADGVSPITATTHLLGSKNVAFLAIQLGIDSTCGIKYDLTSTHTKPLNQQDVTNLIQTAISILGTGAKTSSKAPLPPSKWVGVWGGQVLVSQDRLPASLAITPSMSGTVRAFTKGENPPADAQTNVVATCAPTPKTATVATTPAAPTTSLTPLSRPLRTTASAPQVIAHFQPATYSSSRSAEDELSQTEPESPQVGGSAAPAAPGGNGGGSSPAKDPLAGFAQTIANEGIHHWDVSIAMPVMSYNSLKYDSTNNLLVPKSTTSVNPYALGDWYPFGVDLAAYSGTGLAVSLPKITAGIPIGNQPLQKPFFGAGFIGTYKSFHFQPIVGLHVQKEIRPNSATSTATHTEWHAKLQVMIGFSITDAKKVLGIK